MCPIFGVSEASFRRQGLRRLACAVRSVRQLTDKRLSDYDLHINVIGGGNIDGPSAGCAITCAILSAIEKKPLRQDIAITGEIALSGEVKPVGGIHEKAFGARQAGMKVMILPEKNKSDIDAGTAGIAIRPVANIRDVWEIMTGK